jgi:hypothetical protein
MFENLVKERTDRVGQSAATDWFAAHKAGKKYGKEFIQALEDDLFAGQISAVDMIDTPLIDIGSYGPTDHLSQGFA